MKLKISGFIFAFFMLYVNVKAQNLHSKDLFKVAPASPNAAGLGKYGEIPVNLNTGIPNISVPLYTIKSGAISMPIHLTYHASGNKVDDVASWVGLSWSLNAGGVITRSINGNDDIIPSDQTTLFEGYVNPNNNVTAMITNPSSDGEVMRAFFLKIRDNWIDGEPDIFHFNFGNYAGKFFWNQTEQKFIEQSLTGLSIEYQPLNNGFELIAPDGLIYHFTQGETIKKENVIIPHSQNTTTIISTVSWYLSSINDPRSGKSVSLYYQSNIGTNYASKPVERVFKLLGDGDYHYSDEIVSQGDVFSPAKLKLTHINFDDGWIEFVSSNGRLDDPDFFKLDKVIIRDLQNQILHRWKFTYDYFTSDGTPSTTYPSHNFKRLKLTQVQDQTLSESTPLTNPFVFTYNELIKLPHRHSFSQDHWGYYNGKSTNTTLVPPLLVTNTEYTGGANRSVDPNYTQAWSLVKIKYPTGGQTSFYFENNTCTNTLTDNFAAGLRIERTVTSDGFGNNSTRRYLYIDQNNSTTGVFEAAPNYFYNYLSMEGGNTNTTSFDAIKGLSTSNNKWNFYGEGGFYYKEVTVMEGENGENGKAVHKFLTSIDNPDDGYFTDWADGGVPSPKYISYSIGRGLPKETTIYKRLNGSTDFSTLKKEQFTYDFFTETPTYSIGVLGFWTFDAMWAEANYAHDPYLTCNMCIGPTSAANAVYHLRSNKFYLKQKITSDYLPSGVAGVVNTEDYTINNNNYLNSLIKRINSKGEEVFTEIKYPADYTYSETYSPNSLNEGILALKSANILVEPVLVVTKLKIGSNEKIISSHFSEYSAGDKLPRKIYKLELPEPLSSLSNSFSSSTGLVLDAKYKESVRFNAYSFGNILEQQKPNDIKESFIWDNSGSNLIASVVNASHESIAFTSFEIGATGGWSFSSSAHWDFNPPSGLRVYNVANGNITKSSVANGDYIISYWSRSGSLLVNGSVANITGRTIGYWTYYEHLLAVSTGSITVTTNGSGNGIIDELRLYPKGSLMKSYTHKSEVGITTVTDENNNFTYFQFDLHGRLFIVRDANRNVLKKYCYNYSGQTEDCNYSLVGNDAISRTFTRNNCPNGTTPGTVTFSFIAGIYSATSKQEANAIALAELLIQGQAYANTNATCE